MLSSLSERTGFVDQAQYMSGLSPCSWDYDPKEVRPRSAGRGWKKPKDAKVGKKDGVGPGKYAEGVEKAQALTKPLTPGHTFSRSTNSSPVDRQVKMSKAVPPVGSYKNLAKVYQKLHYKQERTTIILPYKHKGFADDDIKRAKLTPGPGAYHIGPRLKN